MHELSPFSVVSASRQVLVPAQHMLSRKKIIFRKRSCTHALHMVQFLKAFPLSSTALSLKSKLTSVIILEGQLWFNFFWSNLASQTLFQKSKIRKRMFTQRSYSGIVVTEQLASLVRKDSMSNHYLNFLNESYSSETVLTLLVPYEIACCYLLLWKLLGGGTWLLQGHLYLAFYGLYCMYVFSIGASTSSAQKAIYCITSNKPFPRQNYKSGSVRWISEFHNFLFI